MARIIGLAFQLVSLLVAGSLGGLAGFAIGGPLGAVLLFALAGFIGFFAAPLVWRHGSKSKEGQ
jgi:hypothetical protein